MFGDSSTRPSHRFYWKMVYMGRAIVRAYNEHSRVTGKSYFDGAMEKEDPAAPRAVSDTCYK